MDNKQAAEIVQEIKNSLTSIENTTDHIEIHDNMLWSLLEEVAKEDFLIDRAHSLFGLPIVMAYMQGEVYTIYSE